MLKNQEKQHELLPDATWWRVPWFGEPHTSGANKIESDTELCAACLAAVEGLGVKADAKHTNAHT